MLPKCVTVDNSKRGFLPLQFTGLDVCKYCKNLKTRTSVSAPKVTDIFQNLLAATLRVSPLIFRMNFNFLSRHHSQLSYHATFCVMCSIILSTFQSCFKIAPLISLLSCHQCNTCTRVELKSLIKHPFRNVLTAVT